MGKIIAFSGAHGTGKSTAAFELAAQLKKQVPGEIGLILEVARDCPYSVLRSGQQTEPAAQMWIFAEQIRRDLDAIRRYECVVADRTVVDCIAYSSVSGFHDLAYAQVAMARHHMWVYGRVIFRGAAQFDYLKDDGFRDLRPGMQLEVQLRMLELYAQLGVQVERAEAGPLPTKP